MWQVASYYSHRPFEQRLPAVRQQAFAPMPTATNSDSLLRFAPLVRWFEQQLPAVRQQAFVSTDCCSSTCASGRTTPTRCCAAPNSLCRSGRLLVLGIFRSMCGSYVFQCNFHTCSPCYIASVALACTCAYRSLSRGSLSMASRCDRFCQQRTYFWGTLTQRQKICLTLHRDILLVFSVTKLIL